VSNSSHGDAPAASPSDAPVEFRRSGPIGEIILNRPEKRNAITPEMAILIDTALREIETDDYLRIGLLSANGKVAFSAGADLNFIANGDGQRFSTEHGGFGGIARFRRSKPLIAAIQGVAVVGGFELAVACDILVAERSCRFSLPEVTRGLIANGGGLIRLARLLPRPLAMDVILTGRQLSADEALDFGLVSRLVEDGRSYATARELAERIAGLSPAAVAASITIADLAANQASEDLWAECARLADDIRASDAAVDGARQFLGQR
jgi:enoyl-CoA hydratase